MVCPCNTCFVRCIGCCSAKSVLLALAKNTLLSPRLSLKRPRTAPNPFSPPGGPGSLYYHASTFSVLSTIARTADDNIRFRPQRRKHWSPLETGLWDYPTRSEVTAGIGPRVGRRKGSRGRKQRYRFSFRSLTVAPAKATWGRGVVNLRCRFSRPLLLMPPYPSVLDFPAATYTLSIT